jgi:hypothetical protein
VREGLSKCPLSQPEAGASRSRRLNLHFAYAH